MLDLRTAGGSASYFGVLNGFVGEEPPDGVEGALDRPVK